MMNVGLLFLLRTPLAGDATHVAAAPNSAPSASTDDPGRILVDAKSAFDYAHTHLMISHDSHHHLVQGYSCAPRPVYCAYCSCGALLTLSTPAACR